MLSFINSKRWLVLFAAVFPLLIVAYHIYGNQYSPANDKVIEPENESVVLSTSFVEKPLPSEIEKQEESSNDDSIKYAASQVQRTITLNPVITEAENSSAKQQTYLVKELRPASINDYRIVFKHSFVAIGFVWNEGSFEYSFDGNNYFEPESVGDDRPETFNENASELIFPGRTISAIYIKTSYVSGLEINLLTPQAVEAGISDLNANYKGVTFTNLGIRSRQQWGADESKALWYPSYRKINKIIIHHTAGSNFANDWSAVVRSIYAYHAVSLDWGDIGYNYLIDPNGVIYEGRQGGEGVTGGHAYGSNNGSIGIALLGNFSEQSPTNEAMESLTSLIEEKSAIHGLNPVWGVNVLGHRDVNSTACPGNVFYSQLPSISNSLALNMENNMQDIITQRIASENVFSSWIREDHEIYGDLLITFNVINGTDPQVIRSKVPPFSSIQSINVNENRAHLRLHRYYQGEYLDLYRAKLLHLLFSLNPEVVDIEIVGDYFLL